ncbi:PD40 domain-containing protein [Halobacillus locisalis]|uniref:PD40 domain-containing protein n=1 Tax=Halobacillus locisalis TaxID=220753 RepID=A0A838CWE1_9BACI|nr:PD40 domain-containing protein [Halobacillus locisalis]MBA2176244.1 PD40 domain-containing protein [Halobacillus locisalis]
MKRINKKSLWFIAGMIILYVILSSTGSMSAGPTGYTGLEDFPALSPDDETLIFPYAHNGTSSLYKMAMNGGEAERILPPDEGFSFEEPTFAPDGESFTFLKKGQVEEDVYAQLMLYEYGSARPLTEKQHNVLDTAFTPDGKSIYYTMYRNGVVKDFEFRKMNLDSGESEVVDHSVDFKFGAIDMLSDNEIFYLNISAPFEFSDQLMFADLNTGDQTPVTLEESYESQAGHGPALSHPVLSSDHERIAFADVGSTTKSGRYIYNIFVMDRNGENIEQVTNVQDYAGSPTFFHNRDRLLYTRDRNFGTSRERDLEYWIVDLENNIEKELMIDMP